MTDYTSTSYTYSSTTNLSDAGAPVGHRFSTASTTDKAGNTVVRTARQDMGRPVTIEERRYDRSGQEEVLPPSSAPATPIEGVNGSGGGGGGGVRRITELDDDETAGYGDVVYSLGVQDGAMWESGNRGKATYVTLSLGCDCWLRK